MIPQYYEFQNSAKLLSGQFALEHIPAEMEGLGMRKPLFVSDRTLNRLGVVQTVLDALAVKGEVPLGGIYTDISGETSSDGVNAVAGVYRERGCDGMIALGGGAVMDTIKGVAMMISQKTDDITKLMGSEILTKGNRVPWIAIPTTAGTGSEATLVAVITDSARHIKMEYISYYLLPDVAVLDPRMTQTLPPKITASTGMDALCHAVEAYTSLQKNPVSDAYATAVMTLIREYLPAAVSDGKNQEARMAMANAAYMAGAAFSNAMVGIVHAVGHALGGVCGVAHADAMTVLLPFGMAYNLDKCQELYGELLLYLGGAQLYASTPAEKRAEKAIDCVRRMTSMFHASCGLPVNLQQMGVEKSSFEKVARTAMNDGALLVNPKQADFEDIMALLDRAY